MEANEEKLTNTKENQTFKSSLHLEVPVALRRQFTSVVGPQNFNVMDPMEGIHLVVLAASHNLGVNPCS